MKISRILDRTVKALLLLWRRCRGNVEGREGREGEREEEKEMVLLEMGILERNGEEAMEYGDWD